MRLRGLILALMLMPGLCVFRATESCAVEAGVSVPDLSLPTIDGGDAKPFSSFLGGKGAVVVVFSTWSPRSMELLAFAKEAFPRYEANGLKVFALCVDHEDMTEERLAETRKAVAEVAPSFPILLDVGLKIYGGIGVITVPTTLLVGKDLVVREAYPGFPTAARLDLPERIEEFAGIAKPKDMTAEKARASRVPKNHAQQFFNLGKMMFQNARSPSGELRGIPDSAIDRFDEAIRRDPEYPRPHVLLAILFQMAHDDARRDAALAELAKIEVSDEADRRFMAAGYLLLGKDGEARKAIPLVVDVDAAELFPRALLLARTRDAVAKAVVDALKADLKAEELLGVNPKTIFAPDGTLLPGSERATAHALEKLMGVEKMAQGGVPVMTPAEAPAK